MTSRAVPPRPLGAVALTADESRAECLALLARLHTFAHLTGATPGDDVVRWFDFRLRAETADSVPA